MNCEVIDEEENEEMPEAGAGQAPAALQGPVFPALPRKRRLSDRQKVC